MKKVYLLIIFALIGFLLSIGTAKADESTASTTIKYDLAYPGMLPDSPLYKLKVLRDKITEALINDPKTKIEFYLLKTNKEILASAILVDKRKIDLALDTAYKAENNYTKITFQFWKFGNKRLDNKFYETLKTAALKHQEVLASLTKRVEGEDKKKFMQILDFSKTNLNTLEKFQNRRVILQ